jgi:catechol 2,3-dioxygenase-like lactoylglutathione lyase family enzyme
MSDTPQPYTDRYCPTAHQLVPEIYVSSLPISISFYISLGFHLDWHVPNYFAQLSWNQCLLFLKVKATTKSPLEDSISAGNVRIMIRDVDAKYAECLKLGCRVEQEVGDRKFVLRDFVVRDPDGWGVRFGSFLEGRGRKEQEGPDDEIVVEGG